MNPSAEDKLSSLATVLARRDWENRPRRSATDYPHTRRSTAGEMQRKREATRLQEKFVT